MEQLVVGGGCFWCVEGGLKNLRGVSEAIPGYTGGETQDPTYQQVCSGNTGHAEVVIVTFDEQTIPLKTLLEVFFTLHDPTQLNRQGADIGTQYRSVIFTADEQQKITAEEVIEQCQLNFDNTIVTEISPLGHLYIAEDYHHDYFEMNQNAPYCSMVIKPKLNKFFEENKSILKEN
jgi:methionine-S-sulfoxide reductase